MEDVYWNGNKHSIRFSSATAISHSVWSIADFLAINLHFDRVTHIMDGWNILHIHINNFHFVTDFVCQSAISLEIESSVLAITRCQTEVVDKTFSYNSFEHSLFSIETRIWILTTGNGHMIFKNGPMMSKRFNSRKTLEIFLLALRRAMNSLLFGVNTLDFMKATQANLSEKIFCSKWIRSNFLNKYSNCLSPFHLRYSTQIIVFSVI